MDKARTAGADRNVADGIGIIAAPEDQIAAFQITDIFDQRPAAVRSKIARRCTGNGEARLLHAVADKAGTVERIRTACTVYVRRTEMRLRTGNHALNAGPEAAGRRLIGALRLWRGCRFRRSL